MKSAVLAGLVFLCASSAYAQSPFTVRGVADIGVRTFTAKKSFEAILGRNSGPVFGGGIDIVERRGFFGEVRASRFRRTGRRVFVFGGEVFPLDAADTVTITPVEFTAGYRWIRPSRTKRPQKTVPYAGGGAGLHRLDETSVSSVTGEDAHEMFLGYHVLGGAEIRVARLIAMAGEAQWTTVPNALGQDPNSVSRALGESNLGGLSARIKIIIGH